jgi:hypothetical protein
MKAHEVATLIAESPQSIEEKLSWHFSNFSGGTIPAEMIAIARDSILIANTGGNLETEFTLPDGINRYGEKVATASDIIEGFHLQYFIAKEVA